MCERGLDMRNSGQLNLTLKCELEPDLGYGIGNNMGTCK